MDVYLVRHGETPLNAVRVFQFPDTPLSERGAAQAGRAGQRLAGAGLRTILTSDYVRARATADAIHEATGAPIEIEPLLRERHFGVHRGCAYNALDVDVFAPDYAPPGGESWPEFKSRVDAAWNAVRGAARARGPIAVVTHGLVCGSIGRFHLILPASTDLSAVRWVNCSVTEIEATTGPRWQAVRLACAAHLEGLEALPPSRMRSD